jgi:molybdopterin-guanine dinucleotide biosynthesis protein
MCVCVCVCADKLLVFFLVVALSRKPPIYMVHGNRGSGRTTILSKVAQELQQKLIDKEFDGAVISHFQAGGTFGEVVAYLKTEVALQTRGSSAFEQFPSEDGEAVAQSSAAQLAVSSQKRHLASLSSTAKVTVSSSKSIEFDHAKRMLTELKQELHVRDQKHSLL